MKAKKIAEIVTKLSSAVGISGREEEALNIASAYLEEYTDQIKKDRFGNLLAFKQGEKMGKEGLTLAVVAHVDEIGAMVTKIEPGGFLRFTTVGGIDARVFLGQPVVVYGEEKFKGVVGARAPHLLSEEERKKTVAMDKLYVDIGRADKEVQEKVKVGDYISFDQKPVTMANDFIVSGKAIDNRAGVAVLIAAAEELSRMRFEANICFVLSLQEEVGLRGAVTLAYDLKPDICLVIDVTHGDLPGLGEDKTYKLGKGPTISIGPNLHPVINQKIRDIAEELNIKFQIEATPGNSGTDAWAIQVSREGVPTALLSIPLRYMHTPVEVVNSNDILDTGRLVSAFAQFINRSFVEELMNC